MNSNKFSLNTVDYKKVGMHIVIVGVSAVITYFLNEVLPNLFSGDYAAAGVLVISTALKALQRFLSSY